MSSLTSKSNLYRINGVVDTSKPVMENINDICQAGIGFLSYDIGRGAWTVTNNEPRSVSASFDDSNIIGELGVTGSGVNELFNSITIQFPHRDIKDRTDFIDLEIPTEDRFQNELDNRLNINNPLISDPLQAQYIAGVELLQNRFDKIVEFRTDYTSLGLKAGDIIEVTNDIYGFVSKKFQIIRVDEDDSEALVLNITALEYDDAIYDTSSLTRNNRSTQTGISPIELNDPIKELDAVDVGAQIQRLLLANAGLSVLGKLFNRFAGNVFGEDEETDVVKFLNNEELLQSINEGEIGQVLTSLKLPSLTSISAPSQACQGQTVTVNVGHSCSACFIDLGSIDYSYQITGVDAGDIGIPLSGNLTVAPTSSGGQGQLVIPTNNTGVVQKTMTVNVDGLTRSISLDQPNGVSYNVVSSSNSINEGQSVTFTINTTEIADGTTVNWVITGSAEDQITSQLSGTATINNNTSGGIVVTTGATSDYTGDLTMTFTISPTLPGVGNCRPSSILARSVTVVDLTPKPEEPPAPPADIVREYVGVPVVWIGTYDGTDNQLKSISVLTTAQLPKPLPGEDTVLLPTTVTVTKGNPSTISVTDTVEISTTALLGGTAIEVITNFDDIQPLAPITGTKATVFGFY